MTGHVLTAHLRGVPQRLCKAGRRTEHGLQRCSAELSRTGRDKMKRKWLYRQRNNIHKKIGTRGGVMRGVWLQGRMGMGW